MLDSQGITLNYTARIFQTSENLNQLSLISCTTVDCEFQYKTVKLYSGAL